MAFMYMFFENSGIGSSITNDQKVQTKRCSVGHVYSAKSRVPAIRLDVRFSFISQAAKVSPGGQMSTYQTPRMHRLILIAGVGSNLTQPSGISFFSLYTFF